jgi:DnaJ homolog subfamily C member 28
MVEYFLNRILQRQGAAPPWVQAQVDLTSAFAQFRQSIRTEWLRHVTRQISTAPGNLNSHISAAEAYVRRDTAANFTVREYKVEWESREKAYHSLAVNDLNAKARSYNMIAPYTARKAYTDLQTELEQCYKDVAPQIVDAVRARGTAPPPPNVEVKPFVRGAVGILEDLAGPKEQLHVTRDGEYGLMDFFRGFLKRETR